MSEFLIDIFGNQIWYDLKSYEYNREEDISHYVKCLNEPEFFVRLHRENGPAVISPNETQFYYIKGKMHNENGPATYNTNGSIWWALDNTIYSFYDWCKLLNKSEEEINFLKLKWI